MWRASQTPSPRPRGPTPDPEPGPGDRPQTQSQGQSQTQTPEPRVRAHAGGRGSRGWLPHCAARLLSWLLRSAFSSSCAPSCAWTPSRTRCSSGLLRPQRADSVSSSCSRSCLRCRDRFADAVAGQPERGATHSPQDGVRILLRLLLLPDTTTTKGGVNGGTLLSCLVPAEEGALQCVLKGMHWALAVTWASRGQHRAHPMVMTSYLRFFRSRLPTPPYSLLLLGPS